MDSATAAGTLSATPTCPRADWQAQGTLLYNGHTETEYLFARTCCNALLIAYKIAEPVQCQRALALLTAITQCAPRPCSQTAAPPLPLRFGLGSLTSTCAWSSCACTSASPWGMCPACEGAQRVQVSAGGSTQYLLPQAASSDKPSQPVQWLAGLHDHCRGTRAPPLPAYSALDDLPTSAFRLPARPWRCGACALWKAPLSAARCADCRNVRLRLSPF